MTDDSEREPQVDVVLVDMPYADVFRPSLALGLIQAHLEKSGISTKVIYANLNFAECAGPSFYLLVSKVYSEFYLPDWTFHRTIFRHDKDEDEYYVRKIASFILPFVTSGRGEESIKSMVKNLRELQDKADSFIESLSEKILSMKPRIVGCTSMFHQHMASLALLKKISEKDPTIITILGGANCEGTIGDATHRCFPWVDYVVSGEADGFVAGLFRKILDYGRNIPLKDIPVTVRAPIHRNGSVNDCLLADTCSMEFYKQIDDLPVPEYRDYFEGLKNFKYRKMIHPALLVESSRGCWWGVKNRCLFCGLNHPQASYRTKSPRRFISELDMLEKDYDVHRFEVTDNILDMKYFDTVIPHLKDNAGRRTIFYETKSNLKKEHVKALKDAGCTWIQPGIESLDSRVLKLMNKGVTAWQNINLLKWAREAGLRLSWNLLWGFPGERDEWYDSMAKWLPLLEHLQPPNALVKVQIHRNSHYFEHAKDYGLRLKIQPALKYVYYLPEEDIMDLSYSFLPEGWHDQLNDPPEKMYEGRPGTENVQDVINRWQYKFLKQTLPILSVEDDGELIRVLDSRACKSDISYGLDGALRKLYLACEGSPRKTALPGVYQEIFGQPYPGHEAEEALASLKEKNLLLEIDDRLIALGTKGDCPRLPDIKNFPGGSISLQDSLPGPYF
jgi:ribosomal peptide maturation radical SAM protein 1